MKINKPLSAALAAAGLGYAIGNLNQIGRAHV